MSIKHGLDFENFISFESKLLTGKLSMETLLFNMWLNVKFQDQSFFFQTKNISTFNTNTMIFVKEPL